MDLHLTGKRALVTGASKGIGRAIAETLAVEGCTVDIAGRSAATLEQAAVEMRTAISGADIRVHEADLSREADQRRLAEECIDADILINNAGAAAAGSLDETEMELWHDSWALKVFGYINLSRLFYRSMKARRDGVIVNVIGYAGERLNARYIVGTTANAALMAFTRSTGSQSPDFGVRIMGVNPGYTATDRAEDQMRSFAAKKYGDAERWRDIEADMNLPFGRMATPAEIADMTAFLASSRASYMSGSIVTVDGGAANRNG